LRRVQDEGFDGVRIAEDSIGGFQLPSDFVRLDSALGKATAVDALLFVIAFPALVELRDLGNFQIQCELGGCLAPRPQEERIEHRFVDALALFGHRDICAKRAMDFACLVEQHLYDYAIHRIVMTVETNRLDPLGALSVPVHAPFALLQPVGIPRQVIVQHRPQ